MTHWLEVWNDVDDSDIEVINRILRIKFSIFKSQISSILVLSSIHLL